MTAKFTRRIARTLKMHLDLSNKGDRTRVKFYAIYIYLLETIKNLNIVRRDE